jgi:hypothetical protein
MELSRVIVHAQVLVFVLTEGAAMARPLTKTTDQKLRIVMAVLRGERSAAEAARPGRFAG